MTKQEVLKMNAEYMVRRKSVTFVSKFLEETPEKEREQLCLELTAMLKESGAMAK